MLAATLRLPGGEHFRNTWEILQEYFVKAKCWQPLEAPRGWTLQEHFKNSSGIFCHSEMLATFLRLPGREHFRSTSGILQEFVVIAKCWRPLWGFEKENSSGTLQESFRNNVIVKCWQQIWGCQEVPFQALSLSFSLPSHFDQTNAGVTSMDSVPSKTKFPQPQTPAANNSLYTTKTHVDLV